MIVYNSKEFSKALANCTTDSEVYLLENYVFQNAVAIIRSNGANYYNLLVFSINEKYNQLQKISA